MSNEKTILLLAPTAADQAASRLIAEASTACNCRVQELVVDDNYDTVLDALAGAVVPVVVK